MERGWYMRRFCERCDKRFHSSAGLRQRLCVPCQRLGQSEAGKRTVAEKRQLRSERDQWIRQLATEGLRTQDIARKAKVSRETVRTSLKRTTVETARSQ